MGAEGLPGSVVVPLRGELTLRTVESVRAAVMEHLRGSAPTVVMDLDDVTVVTTPGIGLLLELHAEAVARGGRLTVARPSAMVAEVIRRTQLAKVLVVSRELPGA